MSKNKIYSIAGVAVFVLAAMLISGLFVKSNGSSEADKPTYKVKRGPLVISCVESGTIKAREQTIIKNEVEGKSSIVSIIPEGTRVKKGELLIELDASTLADQKIDQEISVQNTEAAFISAKETLAVAENQAKSDIDLARLTLEFAKQDLEKYIKGDYPYLLDEADAKIALAQEELTRAKQTLEDSNQLAAEKYISQMELQADTIAKKKCELDTSLAIKSRNLLEDYTKKRQIAQYESNVSQAEMAMERTERSAHASVIQAQADLKAKESEYQRQQDKLKKMNNQLEKTKIYAPDDGLVIYATSAKSADRHGNATPLDVGREVQEREELIYLPTGNSSTANIAIHESNLKKTSIGMPAIITVDALPGKTFYGSIETIAPLPDAQSMWLNPDLKVYKTEIYIDGNDPMLRTGMSCQAEIIIQQYQDAVYIPLQAVVRIGDEPTVYVKNGNSLEPRTVKLGLDNNKVIHITEGLKEGEIVLLTPPFKSIAGDSQNSNLSGQEHNGLQEKISNGLKNMKTNQHPADTNQPVNTKIPDTQEPKGQLKNIDPKKAEEMRKQFEKMSPEEKEKLRQTYSGGTPKEQ